MMKKLISLIAMIVLALGATWAQDAKKAPGKAKATTVAAKPAVKKAVTASKATAQTKASVVTKKVTPVVTKKDGTPDMRYKENKAAAAGPKKKDGTLDMRYKANQQKPKTTKKQ